MTEATTSTGSTRPTAGETSVRAGRALTWGAAVLLSVYLGLSGGGYDIVVRSEVGLIVWWFVLLGVLVGVLPAWANPRGRLDRGRPSGGVPDLDLDRPLVDE